MSSWIGVLKDTFRRAPSEAEAFIFEFAALFGRAIMAIPGLGDILRRVGGIFSFILQAITPALPFNTRDNNSFSNDPAGFYWQIFKFSYPITVMFCLGFNAILAIEAGTFFGGATATHMYFSGDGYNIFLYSVVCPLYVSAALCLIATTAMSWQRLNEYSNASMGPQHRVPLTNSARLAVFLTVSFIIAGLFIANYIADLMDEIKTPRVYWFFSLARSGERVLNKAGAYYLFMNAVLLYLTAVAAFCYVAMSIEMFRLGANIERSVFALGVDGSMEVSEEEVRSREVALKRELSDFSYCYIWAKFLVLIYAVNIWVWALSPAGKSSNVHSAILVLSLIGLFFLVVPRLYLGSKWHHLKWRYQDRWSELLGSENAEIEYSDIRSSSFQKMAILLDWSFMLVLAYILSIIYGIEGAWDALAKWVKPYLSL